MNRLSHFERPQFTTCLDILLSEVRLGRQNDDSKGNAIVDKTCDKIAKLYHEQNSFKHFD